MALAKPRAAFTTSAARTRIHHQVGLRLLAAVADGPQQLRIDSRQSRQQARV
jgi:hypothetical protein